MHALVMARLNRLALATAALLALGGGVAAAQTSAPPIAARGAVVRIPVNGTIEMGLAPFVERALGEAEAAGAAAVVLDLDTPGGRIDAAERIADALRDAKIPTYAYVNRRAFSAGALIALATDGIYMRPGSTLGAATPVDGSGAKASEKMVSAMRSEFRALAEQRGLDPQVAEAMVDETLELPGIKPNGQLLTLSTGEAVRLGYAREVADFDALLGTIGAPAAEVHEATINWAERLVRFFTNPLVAPLLLSLGFLGLIVELKSPSFGVAALAGVTSLGLFFGSHLLLGLAGWEVLLLLAVGVILLLVEALVLPGFGVAGVLGLLAVAAGIVLSMVGSAPSAADVLIALNVLGISVIIVVLLGWQFLRYLPQDRRAARLVLQTSTTREAGYLSNPLRDELLGTRGVALTDLRPAGTAVFGEESVDVVSDGDWVSAGTPVEVVRAEGYRHVVRPVDESGS